MKFRSVVYVTEIVPEDFVIDKLILNDASVVWIARPGMPIGIADGLAKETEETKPKKPGFLFSRSERVFREMFLRMSEIRRVLRVWFRLQRHPG